MSPEVLDRFMAKVIPEPMSGCWLWMGSHMSKLGYGTFCSNKEKESAKRVKYAHRVAFEHFVGPIPAGRSNHVCHKCDNTACVNPDHLYLGTAQSNISDRERRGRHNVRSKSGLPFGVRRAPEWDRTGKGYRTEFTFRNRRYSAGAFATEEEAAVAIAALWERCYHTPPEPTPPT